jgi:hypothetical protein
MKNAGALKVSTPTDREAVVTRVFDAPRRLVFDAWASPKHLPRWMLGPEGWTMPVCEIDLRPGGAHRCVWRGADGTEMGSSEAPATGSSSRRFAVCIKRSGRQSGSSPASPGVVTGPKRSTR